MSNEEYHLTIVSLRESLNSLRNSLNDLTNGGYKVVVRYGKSATFLRFEAHERVDKINIDIETKFTI